MKDILETIKTHYRWLLGALLLVAALLISYFTWWPLPAEEAYSLQLAVPSLEYAMEGEEPGRIRLFYTLEALNGLSRMRAQKSAEANILSWTSSDPGVVQVDEEGELTLLDRGEATVTLSWGGLSQSCLVRVYYPLTGISLSESGISLDINEEVRLSHEPVPPKAELQEAVLFSSSDPGIASVDEQGTVKALSVGTARITARSGDFETSCQITVLSPMTGMALSARKATLNVEESLGLVPEFYPADTTDERKVLWISSDPAVASVDAQGQVRALGPGEAEITARTGAFSATARITVKAPLKGISFEEESRRLLKGESLHLELIPEPDNTTDALKPLYASSQPDIVSVDSKGQVTALAPGESIITARVGDFSTSCQLIVRVPMEGIHIPEEGGSLVRGEEKALSIAFYPEDTNDERTVAWSSSDPAVLSVDGEGRLKAQGVGMAQITARCGEFSAAVSFDVIVPVSGVAMDRDSLTLTKSSSASLSAWVLPEDTTEDRGIYFTSSDAAVVSVDGGGNLWAAGPGECVITAWHGNYAASCRVQVTVPLKGISLDRSELSLLQGKGDRLYVSFDPWDTTDSRWVSWTSSDPGVAGVDESGNIWASASGDAWITATAGAFSASALIHVEAYIPVQQVGLSETAISLSYHGETRQLEAWAEPANATNPWIGWASSDPSVATVGADGTVTAVGDGTAWITASADGQSASCQVQVTLPSQGKIVVLDPGHGGIFDGAIYAGRYERHMNLTTAYACKNYLEAHFQGVTVYMTRSGDVALEGDLKADLRSRAALASSLGADILVSLHYNGSLNHDASGVTVYASFDSAVSEASSRLARVMVDRLAAYTGLHNYGVHYRYYDEYGLDPAQGDYYGIIRHSASFGIPAVLVEHCHMDYDLEWVDSEEDLVNFGIQDAIAIAEYLGLEWK